MIDPKDWKWYGLSAHFICGRWCRFHMATLIGDTLVSTVGQFVHPRQSGGGEQTEAAYLLENPNGERIGHNRFYETMTFKATGKVCTAEGCECGLPEFEGCEIEANGYQTAGEATRGHMEMCMRVAETSEKSKTGGR